MAPRRRKKVSRKDSPLAAELSQAAAAASAALEREQYRRTRLLEAEAIARNAQEESTSKREARRKHKLELRKKRKIELLNAAKDIMQARQLKKKRPKAVRASKRPAKTVSFAD